MQTTRDNYTDQESIEIVTRALQASGFTNIQNMNDQDPYYCYDLYAEYRGMRLAFEVKNRSFSSEKYDSTIFRVDKYNRLIYRSLQDKILQVYIVEIYTDGYMRIFRLQDWTSQGERVYRHTEHYNNRKKEVQQVLFYPHTENNKYKIER